VYSALAQPDAATVLAQMQEKILDRVPASFRDAHQAPQADLSVPQAGDAADLEERIDEPAVAPVARATQLKPLSDLLSTMPAQAMLVYSATETPASGLTTVHAGVVVAAAGSWDAQGLAKAISAAIAPQISVGVAGLNWQPQQSGNIKWVELNGMQSLALGVSGNVVVLATDRATLLRMLNAAATVPRTAQVAGRVAGFNHSSERDAFGHMTSTLDQYIPGKGGMKKTDAGNEPPFFAGNMVSLSNTFQDLESETFTESAATNVVHQSVRYEWKK
jgi:hypothetical protein